MNYSMQATGTLQGFISSFTELELKMNGISIPMTLCAVVIPHAARLPKHVVRLTAYACLAVAAGIERVTYYSDIATEKPYEKDDKAKLDDPARKIEVAPRGWPSRGEIEFRNVCARYRKELSLVLDTVSFDVSSGQKVGV